MVEALCFGTFWGLYLGYSLRMRVSIRLFAYNLVGPDLTEECQAAITPWWVKDRWLFFGSLFGSLHVLVSPFLELGLNGTFWGAGAYFMGLAVSLMVIFREPGSPNLIRQVSGPMQKLYAEYSLKKESAC